MEAQNAMARRKSREEGAASPVPSTVEFNDDAGLGPASIIYFDPEDDEDRPFTVSINGWPIIHLPRRNVEAAQALINSVQQGVAEMSSTSGSFMRNAGDKVSWTPDDKSPSVASVENSLVEAMNDIIENDAEPELPGVNEPSPTSFFESGPTDTSAEANTSWFQYFACNESYPACARCF